MSHVVFVYGTLKRGFYNHQFLARCKQTRFVGEGITRNEFYLSVGGPNLIPYLQRPQTGLEGKLVKGEVYLVGDDMLNKLDVIEDVPRHYVRKVVAVDIQQGTDLVEKECFIYVKSEYDAALLENGLLDEYDLSIHGKYTPPPMRTDGEWRNIVDKHRQEFSQDGNKDSGKSVHIYSSPLWDLFIKSLFDSPVSKNGSLLELGCGNKCPATRGILGASLANPLTNYHCVDNCEEQLKRAAVGWDHTCPQFSQIDILEMGKKIESSKYAGVVCAQVFSYIPEELVFHAFRSTIASLAPGGLAYVEWPTDKHDDFCRYISYCNLRISASDARLDSTLAILEKG
mmetsp:Transcript_7602/g.12300  ORF Transcript_7602/g.12300 Transcript_7602/m.12300 type:complete len:341 (+) Transcript_7602:2278-3300(+)|eukprot:CAMPEP_0203757678 /NCGR_PEP_ID=MMETSP0098-20131031/10625_1 /ASSEMBLY_ACC=CAM_ASM_000208 /TAXON_ID=96639 /ORGANISM=" , Strain NY0313808BC1" /LENGTH=340 /DNA_ID=CAMNT_0050649905 /DNA_START=2278 /DNA_END=3300 /DNA_ORIENTATION=-